MQFAWIIMLCKTTSGESLLADEKMAKAYKFLIKFLWCILKDWIKTGKKAEPFNIAQEDKLQRNCRAIKRFL